MNLRQRAVASPGAIVMMDRRPGREVLGQQAPLAAGLCEIHQRIDDSTHIGRRPAASARARLSGRNVRLDQRPLLIREVSGVSGSIHAPHHRHNERFLYRFSVMVVVVIPES